MGKIKTVSEEKIRSFIREKIDDKNLYLKEMDFNILTRGAVMLYNHLTVKDAFNSNVTVCAESQEESNKYGEILAESIVKFTAELIEGYLVCDEEEFYETSNWEKACERCPFLIVRNYEAKNPDKLFEILEGIEKKGWSLSILLCMTTDTAEKLKQYEKQDYRLFNYLCGYKVIVSELDNEDIYKFVLNKLEAAKFSMTDAFCTRLQSYIDVIYPEACLKKEEFVNDLIQRIYQIYYQKISTVKRLDVGDVPYSKKLEIALEKHDDETNTQEGEMSINEAVQETHFTDLENRKNVLILSMSTLPKKKNCSQYYIIEEDDSGKKKYQAFSGVSQLEPGTKYFLSKLARKNIKPDEIIILTTKETWEKEEAYKEDGKEKSAVDVYSENIVHFLKSNGDHGVEKQLKDAVEQCDGMEELDFPTDFSTLFSLDEGCETSHCQCCGVYQSEYLDELNQYFTVKPVILGENSLFEISEELNSLLSSENLQSKKEGVNLFIDLQGGTRTYMFTLFAALTLWRDKDVKIKDMFAIKFDPSKKYHPIESVRKEYAMIDLVSGIRAFTRYGKVGELQQFIESRGNGDESVKKLLEIMQDIDGYMQINNPEDFKDKLKELVKGCLLDKENYQDNQFKLIVDDLKETYAPIILNHPSDLDIIKWFGEKEFTTSALTFIEDKIPGWMIGESEDSIIQIKFNKYNRDIVREYKNYGAQSYYKKENNIFHAVFKNVIQDLENTFYKECCKDWANLLITNIKKTNKKSEQLLEKKIAEALYLVIFEKQVDTEHKEILDNLTAILKQYDGEYFKNIKVTSNKGKCSMTYKGHPIAYDLWLKLMCLKTRSKDKEIRGKANEYVVEGIENNNLNKKLNDRIVNFEIKMDENSLIEYALRYCEYRSFLDKAGALNNYRYNKVFNENCSYKNLMLYQELGYQKELKEHFPYTDAEGNIITTIAGVADGGKRDNLTIIIGDNKEKRRLLNVCILLYRAMKSERNATNHATERNNHMDYRYTQQAIKVFVELCEKLLDISKKDMKNNNMSEV